ncbi:MAG: Holliday junction resolvase RuvX [Gammaproteobacteria bacterium]|nr:Holliday junction resolvase RuvX [Gammaproteobacteria bacterium]
MNPPRGNAPAPRRLAADRPEGPVLGFDYGTERIGVAVGQTLTGTASPLTTLDAHGREPDWAAIDRLIGEWRPVALVIGIPRNMDDSDSEMTARASRFLRQLRARHRLPTYGVDERLTTFDAEQRLSEAGLPRDRARGEIDRVAAQLILETWFAGAEPAT